MSEDSVIDFPDSTTLGEGVQLLIETGKKVSVTVNSPNGDSVDVDVLDSGSHKIVTFSPIEIGTHKVNIFIDSSALNERTIDVLPPKEKEVAVIERPPSVVGFRQRSLAPGVEATCYFYLPPKVDIKDIKVTKMSNTGQQSLHLVSCEGEDYNYYVRYTPERSELKLMISSVLNGKHIEGSPITNEIGPQNTHTKSKIKIQVNEAYKGELYNFHIVTPHTVEIMDFEVEAILKYSENGELKESKLETHHAVSEVQQIDDFLVHSFDADLGVQEKKNFFSDVIQIPKSKSSLSKSRRNSKKLDTNEIKEVISQQEKKEEKVTEPIIPSLGLSAKKEEKGTRFGFGGSKSPREEKDKKEPKSPRDKKSEPKSPRIDKKVIEPKSPRENKSKIIKKKPIDENKPIEEVIQDEKVERVQVFDELKTKAAEAERKREEKREAEEKKKKSSIPMFDELRKKAELAEKNREEKRQAEEKKKKSTAPVFDELKKKAELAEKNREEKRQAEEKKKKSSGPMFDELKSRVEKKAVSIAVENPVEVEYKGQMKRWDCYWVADRDGEVFVRVKIHGKEIPFGPWVIPVNGESNPFRNSVPWENFSENSFPITVDEENAMVFTTRWQTKSDIQFCFCACALKDDGKIEENILEGKKISHTGAIELIPKGKMAGRSTRALLLKLRTLSPHVVAIPIYVNCLSGNFSLLTKMAVSVTQERLTSNFSPISGAVPEISTPTENAFFVGVIHRKDSSCGWVFQPTGKFVTASLITGMMNQTLDTIHKYCPNYTTPESFRLARAPIAKTVLFMELTRTPTWDLSLHSKTKQSLQTTVVTFTWSNEIYTVVKDGEEQGGIVNKNGVQTINFEQISPQVKTIICINTVINPIWDTKPLKILEKCEVNINVVNSGQPDVKKSWANFSIRKEQIGDTCSIIEAKLFRFSLNELWEYNPISICAAENKVEEFLKEFRIVEQGSTSLPITSGSQPTSNCSVSIRPFLLPNWSQEAKHMRVVVLSGRNFLPMKAGTTGGNVFIKISANSDHKFFSVANFSDRVCKPQKLSARVNPFWGFICEFMHVRNFQDMPITFSAYDLDEKYGEILIGSFSLVLSKIFDTSVNSGGSSIERWYKLLPTSDANAAIKHFGSYWGLENEINSLELSLRFITFV